MPGDVLQLSAEIGVKGGGKPERIKLDFGPLATLESRPENGHRREGN
jgi:hypothetical protein